jgi:hypothetical protein
MRPKEGGRDIQRTAKDRMTKEPALIHMVKDRMVIIEKDRTDTATSESRTTPTTKSGIIRWPVCFSSYCLLFYL